MQPSIPYSENQYLQSTDNLNSSDPSIINENEQESRFSFSSQHSMLSQKPTLYQNSRRASLVKPPVCSVCQGDFFRIRDKDKALYPSSCYAVPEKSAFFNQAAINRSYPIQFIGVNVANFDENDQTTRLSDQGEITCEEFDASKRRSSIVVMENSETLRNDEILSQLDDSDDDSDDEDDLFVGRKSMGAESYDAYENIPVSRLRNFIKRKQEIDEVNRRYREMINRIDEERNHRINEDMEVENDYIQDPIQPVIPGQMDSLVDYNNQVNRRLSGCLDSNMMDSEYKANNISSPRLSKVDYEVRETPVKKNLFKLPNEKNYRSVMIQRLRKRMVNLPSFYDIQSIVECSRSILDSSEKTLDLANDVRNSWEKNREIDDNQGELNMKENEMNRLLINLKILQTGSYDCLIRIGDELGEYIKYYASLLGFIANYSDKSDLFLHFPFHEGFFFLKIHFSNSMIVRVTKNHDTIKDEDLNMMLYRLKTIQSIHNEYRCWEIPEMIQKVSNDLTRIKEAWEELHGE